MKEGGFEIKRVMCCIDHETPEMSCIQHVRLKLGESRDRWAGVGFDYVLFPLVSILRGHARWGVSLLWHEKPLVISDIRACLIAISEQSIFRTPHEDLARTRVICLCPRRSDLNSRTPQRFTSPLVGNLEES